MAISRVTTWSSGQVLTASALNGEFNNILDNALSLISPITANLDVNGYRLINVAAGTVGSPGLYFTSDSDTGYYRPAADSSAIAGAGVDVARFTGVTGASTYLVVTHSAVTAIDAVRLETDGATNTPMLLVPEGTGYVGVPSGGVAAAGSYRPGLALTDDNDTGLVQVTTGSYSFAINGREALRATGSVTATNYLNVTAGAAGTAVSLAPAGGDTNIGLELTSKGNEVVSVATAFRPAALSASPTPINTLHRGNLISGWIQFNGTGTPAIGASHNVTSITDNGTGDFTVTWDTDFASTPYAVLIGCQNSAGADPNRVIGMVQAGAPRAVGSVRLSFINENGGTAVDPVSVDVAALGLQ